MLTETLLVNAIDAAGDQQSGTCSFDPEAEYSITICSVRAIVNKRG